ncbi:MAG: efflux transporter outer membrane subunit [Verrucomicrobiota bacterium]
MKAFAALLLLPCLSGCQLLAPLETSDFQAPVHWKETRAQGARHLPDQWWTLYQDAHLNELVEGVSTRNLDLRASLARIEQAYAALGVARADLFPSLSGEGSLSRNRLSEADPNAQFGPNPLTQYQGGAALSWEIDLWGRVRKLSQAAQADAFSVEAATADLRLSLQSQLARNYFALRFLDQEERILKNAIQTRQESLEIAQNRQATGRATDLEVARAEAELATRQAEKFQVQGGRRRLANALAVLSGQAPSDFSLASAPPPRVLPRIQTGLPFETLSARPDVAQALAQIQAAEARVEVARRDFFPRFNLIGSGGLSSISTDEFLEWSSRTFTLGPEVTLPFFQGGRLRANLQERRAAHEEAISNYEQTMLVALQEVEDALVDRQALAAEYAAQRRAVKASTRASQLSLTRYREGKVDSIEVLDALREELDAERRAAQIRGLQFDASVRLFQALGARG